MSEGRPAAGVAHRAGVGVRRVARAWRALPHERRLAAAAAIGLFVTLFLPWYQETVVVASVSNRLQTATQSLTGWAAFSFVEAAVLLVAAGVLTLLFQRAEGRAFHLPGGDGWVIMAAGLWTCVLVVWRIFDKQGTRDQGQVANSSGIEWGIFVALATAAFLVYAGSRIRAAHTPEPPLLGEDRPPSSDWGSDLGEPVTPDPRRPATRRKRGTPVDAPAPAPAPAPRKRGAPADTQESRKRGTAPDAQESRKRGPALDAAGSRKPAMPDETLSNWPEPETFDISRPGLRDPGGREGLERSPASRQPEARDAPPQELEARDAPPQEARELKAREDRRGGTPPPVAADDPPTVRMGEPSTPAARRRQPADSDEQLTMPLDPNRRKE